MLIAKEQDEKGRADGSATGAEVIGEHLQELTALKPGGDLSGVADLVAVAEHFVVAGLVAAAGVPVVVVVAAEAAGSTYA